MAETQARAVKMKDEKVPPCVKGRKIHKWDWSRRGRHDAFKCPHCLTVKWYEHGPKHGTYERFDVGEFSGKAR